MANKASSLEIEKLKHQLKGHQRSSLERHWSERQWRWFGSKSESAAQLDLELRLEEEETADARATPPDVQGEPKQKPKRKSLPPTLPRNEEVLIPGESCTCGGKLRVLGEDDEAMSAIGPRTMDE